MNKSIILISLCFSLACSSRKNIPQNDSGRFIKIELTDQYLKKALYEYSESFDFGGKGVLVANLTSNFDTTKCRVMLILEKDFFNHWLTNRKFVLYDTIDNRIVILSTKLESYFTLLNVYGDNDSIIDKYLITRDSGINEIWEMEYSIVKGRITKKVIYDPIY